MNERYETPKDTNLIYDIGMHKGEDSEFYLKKGFRVIAFEADPDLARSCRTRLKPFIDAGQLTVVEGAIVDPRSVEGGSPSVSFYRNAGVSAWGTVSADWAERNVRLGTSSSVVDVNVVDFAKTMQQYGVPHYMKVDIEGLDMACVDILRLFRERPSYVSLESSKTSLASIKREIDTLVDLGYASFQAVEQSGIPHSQTPPNPPTEGEYVAHRFQSGSSGLFGSELGAGWKTKHAILRQYRAIRLGYYLVGDDGLISRSKFPGAGRLRSLTGRVLRHFTKAAVPGWYDTHARHSSARPEGAPPQATSG